MNPSKDLMTVAMESRTHYVQHLYPLSRELKSGLAVYSLVDYGQLRSLEYPNDNRRSMFGQDSIASGSKRLERFILWPTGVLSPGASGAAMQWPSRANVISTILFFGQNVCGNRFQIKYRTRLGFVSSEEQQSRPIHQVRKL